MGYKNWAEVDWDAHASSTRGMSREEIFTATTIDPSLDPSKFAFREARDSEKNPESTPIMLWADDTGSMGRLAEQIIKTDLGTIMSALYDRKPVPDPAIACGSIGDVECDRAPIQVTQFESDIALVEQLKKFYVEGGGGGNMGESYAYAWAFAAYKTKVDIIKKRKKKGYLFTVGDECALPILRREHLKRFLDLDAQADMSAKKLAEDVQHDWHTFHLIVKPVSDQPVIESWRELLGQRAIVVQDLTKLAAGIVGIISVVEGHDADKVADGWDGDSAVIVRDVAAQLVRN